MICKADSIHQLLKEKPDNIIEGSTLYLQPKNNPETLKKIKISIKLSKPPYHLVKATRSIRIAQFYCLRAKAVS